MNDDLHGRRRILPIEFGTLVEVLRGRVKILEGLPADARIVGIQQISRFDMIEFVIESAEFPKLRQGDAIEHRPPLLSITAAVVTGEQVGISVDIPLSTKLDTSENPRR